MQNLRPLLSGIPEPQKSRHRVLVSLLVATIFATGALAYWYTALFPEGAIRGRSDRLYFSVAPIGFAATDAYIYDLGIDKWLRLQYDDYYKLTPALSPDGAKMAFVGRLRNSQDGNQDIYIAQSDGTSPVRITSGPHQFERGPVWSPDQRLIAFTGSATNTPRSLNDLNIYVTDFDGRETLVSSGGYPQWLPDGRLMGIREDGFYVFDLDKKNLQKVWHFGEPADIGMKIVVSPNGKYLAWIAPRAQEVYLFQIQSLAPASMEPYKIVSAQASWGVFSPDSKKLALVEVSLDARGKVNGNWLTFYDLETNEKTIISGITRVNSELVFLSDWR